VTYYYINVDGISNNFDGYILNIALDGIITATKGTSTFTGVWMVKSSDDDPAYDKGIEFTISCDKQMENLDGSWLITALTDSVAKLKDDTPSEEIHLEKI